jgi:hypothetical protein
MNASEHWMLHSPGYEIKLSTADCLLLLAVGPVIRCRAGRRQAAHTQPGRAPAKLQVCPSTCSLALSTGLAGLHNPTLLTTLLVPPAASVRLL